MIGCCERSEAESVALTETRSGVGGLLALADALNAELESSSGRGERSARGQFATPSAAARTMADLVKPRRVLKVVDPGAGAGALMLALVASAIEREVVEQLSVDLLETDKGALRLLERAVREAHLAAEAHGLELTTRILDRDFCDRSGWAGETRFDAVIVNPPYMKLGASDPCRSMVAERHGVDCPNLYAAFLAVAVELLRDSGQLVAITPRSFANGMYFTDFRHYLTDNASFDHVVLFDRRDRVFESSSVLQETVIFSMHKSAPEPGGLVRVETRADHISAPIAVHDVAHHKIVRPRDPARCINLPGSPDAMCAAEQIAALPADLQSLGLSVSTGPVVDFRCREHLTTAQAEGSVPLIYPVNLKQARVQWPVEARKPQGFTVSPLTRRWLFPNGIYVLVKRFTAKEEKRRVVACVYDPVDGYDHVAFENHVNVIHRDHGPLQGFEADALADFLNSDLVDIYFRMFSGSTQVNATDLRRLRFPQLCESHRPALFDAGGPWPQTRRAS
ncbi:MAG: Eco57I restriction-modification methylase domain-containing protein [Acidimicrobiaceae bacterium]|nr:Eco57I restriction-modification methylase domain-containing protein [Acidimicrobiaceae bacterium]